jgi:subtilisin family serine protease
MRFQLYVPWTLFAVMAGSLLQSCKPQPDLVPQPTGEARVAATLNYVPGEVIVRFKPGTTNGTSQKTLSTLKMTSSERILTQTMIRTGDQMGVILAKTPADVNTAISQLRAMPDVEYAEPNYIYTLGAVSNDPYYTFKNLWGMCGPNTNPANQFGTGAGTAWAVNRIGSPNVIVGIIDEGLMTTHEDLRANIWTNPREIAGNRRDDDGNGYIDDVNGYDFANNDATVYDGTIDDHATHVAGIIGGVGGNGRGVAGINWNVKMISLKFMSNTGGTLANAIRAIDYLTDLKVRHGFNIVASNNSWSGGGYSVSLQMAIERANVAGILFIAAAGNGGPDSIGDNNDLAPTYPANYPNANIISVAALTSAGARASFSNFGATSVDIAAPGVSIWSTVPGAGNTSRYAAYNGTSMAAPHVTGAAALYKAIYPSATATQIRQAILTKAIPTSSMTGRCVTGGRLNVASF